jgi:hypothetical protein
LLAGATDRMTIRRAMSRRSAAYEWRADRRLFAR